MPLYHYASMDHQSWFIKLWQINAISVNDAFDHLVSDDTSLIVSEKKIPVYNNKHPLSTDESDNA